MGNSKMFLKIESKIFLKTKEIFLLVWYDGEIFRIGIKCHLVDLRILKISLI